MSKSAIRKRVVRRARVIDLGNKVDSVDIMCAGDLHIGAPTAEGYREFIRQWLFEKPNRYLILDGDLLDCATKSSVSDVYSDITIEESSDLAIEFLHSIGSKVIANICGNHDERIWKECGFDIVKSVTERASAGLDSPIPYDGMESYTTVRLGSLQGCSKNHPREISYCLFVAHGCQGGRTDGAKANAINRMRDIIPNADAIIAGHVHDPAIKPKSAYFFDNSHQSIIQQKQYLVTTGSPLLREGYAISHVYAPTSMDIPVLRLSGVEHNMTAYTVSF